MKKAQRILVLCGLAGIAIGLHVWHYEYRVGTALRELPLRQQTRVLLWWQYEDVFQQDLECP